MLKKILKITAIILVLLVGFAFAAPFIFKNKIKELVKTTVNEKVNARVDFGDVDISFFRHFPKVSVQLNDLSVAGLGEFDKDTLFSARQLDVAVNLMSLLKGSNYKVYGIIVHEPRIQALVHSSGQANWDISKPDTTNNKTASSPFQLNLQSYEIRNGYIRYEDVQSNMSAEIIGLNHSGSGDFSADLFTLATRTTAEQLSFSYGHIPYLSRVKTSIDAAIQVDNKENKYSFQTDKIAINDLLLKAGGFFQLVNDSAYRMDISYSAPSTEFKTILSLIPALYRKDFASIKTSGKAVLNGFVKGVYDATHLPAYSLQLDVSNGFFQYPDLPRPVQHINFAMRVDNPDGLTDHTVVNLTGGHIEIDKDPFDFRLLLKTPVSDPYIDAAVKGRIDLSTLAGLVKLEAGTRLAGLLNADLNMRGNMGALERKQYQNFYAAGTLSLNDFLYASNAYPDPIVLKKVTTSFNPHNITLSELQGSYMGSQFQGNGSLENVLAYMLQNKPLKGELNVDADRIDAGKWMKTPTDSSAQNSAPANVYMVPAQLDFTVHAKAGQVIYQNLDMQQVSGSLIVRDENVKIENLSAALLDGTMAMNGSYSTKDHSKKPSIAFSYDLKGFDIAKTFASFNTAEKLMPVGKFLSGKLNSQLSVDGKLGQNMLPDLASLTGKGSLLVLEGLLNNFKPLQQISTLLNIKDLEAIAMKDVKTYFEFIDGKVLVKPFKMKVKDIDMEIGGMHGFDQSLNYAINMKVPRAMMGTQGNEWVNNMVGKANSQGVPVKLGDNVNLKVTVGGTITNPVIKTDLSQTAHSLAEDLKQQAVDFAKSKFDSTTKSAKAAASDTLASVKKQLVQAAGVELRNQLFAKPDSGKTTTAGDSRKQVESSARGLLQGLNGFGKKKPAVSDSVRSN